MAPPDVFVYCPTCSPRYALPISLPALVGRRDVLARHAVAGHVVHELVARACTGLGVDAGAERDDDLRELAGTTGLLLVRVRVVLDLLADGLAVGHLRDRKSTRLNSSH